MQLRTSIVLVTLLLFSALTMAQTQSAEAAGTRSVPANNTIMVTLYNQIDALQKEVQTLRGVVEEQGYQLKRLQTEQRDRYLDIDRRLSLMNPAPSLAGSSASPSVTPPPDLSDSSAAISDSTIVTQTPPLTVPGKKKAEIADTSALDEQELYRTALNFLLEQNKHDEAIARFQKYIDNFPKGRLFTNALYWQGEAYLLTSGFAQARDVFQRLLNQYPQDAKAAGAMLKMGTAYKQLGDNLKAAETWRELKTRYPESTNEIRLADEYLRAL